MKGAVITTRDTVGFFFFNTRQTHMRTHPIPTLTLYECAQRNQKYIFDLIKIMLKDHLLVHNNIC